MTNINERLQPELAKLIKPGTKVAIVGAGSVLKGDDAAGMIVAEGLLNLDLDSAKVLIIAGSTAPENFTGQIRAFRPELIFLVDAAHIEASPGSIALIEAEQIQGIAFSTHMLPFPIMVKYLEAEIGCAVHILGIQPASTDYGAPVHPAVQMACQSVIESLQALLA